MKNNQKMLLGTCVLILAAAIPAAYAAAEQTPPPAPATASGPEHKGPGHKGPGHRLQMLSEKLNLSAAQKTQLEPIVKAEAQEIKALMDDTSLTREARHEKIRAVNQKYRPQIQAILTPEQQAKFKEMMQERRQHRPNVEPAPEKKTQ